MKAFKVNGTVNETIEPASGRGRITIPLVKTTRPVKKRLENVSLPTVPVPAWKSLRNESRLSAVPGEHQLHPGVFPSLTFPPRVKPFPPKANCPWINPLPFPTNEIEPVFITTGSAKTSTEVKTSMIKIITLTTIGIQDLPVKSSSVMDIGDSKSNMRRSSSRPVK
jgi:hypothetical protein